MGRVRAEGSPKEVSPSSRPVNHIVRDVLYDAEDNEYIVYCICDWVSQRHSSLSGAALEWEDHRMLERPVEKEKQRRKRAGT